jgi:hypothetical protein
MFSSKNIAMRPYTKTLHLELLDEFVQDRTSKLDSASGADQEDLYLQIQTAQKMKKEWATPI